MRLRSRNARETVKIGRMVGQRLKRGQTVCLYGELGAGKTTLVKGIAGALGIDEAEITSASFTIISEHEGNIPMYHIDLYRLAGDADIENIGLYDVLGRDGVSVVEWAERADMPASVSIRIEFADKGSRDIIIEGLDE